MSYKDIRFFYLSLQIINNNNVWPNRFLETTTGKETRIIY